MGGKMTERAKKEEKRIGEPVRRAIEEYKHSELRKLFIESRKITDEHFEELFKKGEVDFDLLY
ncbi:hypothetical protein [Thermococcus prieurii]